MIDQITETDFSIFFHFKKQSECFQDFIQPLLFIKKISKNLT